MKKFLFIRFSSIGDIIFSTPLPTIIKRNYPSSEIHFLTLKDFTSLLEHHPHIDRIISFDRRSGIAIIRKLAKAIEDENYYAVFDIHNSLRSKLLRWYSTDVNWTIYKKDRWRRLLLFYFHVNQAGNEDNISEKYLKSIYRFMRVNSLPQPQLKVTPYERLRAQKIINSYRTKTEYITVIPGAAWKTKMWHFYNYINLLKTLLKNYDILILGGKNDTICDKIAKKIPETINLKGETDLRTALAIMADAKIAIGSDTGLIHGAEAVGTPVVMITGPTSYETGAHVRLNRSNEIGLDFWCRPCSKNGSRPCYRKKQFCMDKITPDMVMNVIQQALA